MVVEAIYENPYKDICASDNDSNFCTGRGAARCILSPCVKTYSAEIRGGFLVSAKF